MPIEITNVAKRGPKGDTGPSGEPFLARSAVPITLINPISTFTGVTVSDNGAGKVLLTGAGAHGLSAANAIGASIHIISGTGWSSGLKKIISLDADVTGVAIALDVPFASQGSPTIALQGTWVTHNLTQLPALNADSIVEISLAMTFTNSANAKGFAIQGKSGGVNISQVDDLSGKGSYIHNFFMHNRGATNSQACTPNKTVGGVGGSTDTIFAAAYDLSVPGNLNFIFKPAAAEPFTLERYVVRVWS